MRLGLSEIPELVIARRFCAEAIQSPVLWPPDCFAEPVIGPAFGRTRCLAMTTYLAIASIQLQRTMP